MKETILVLERTKQLLTEDKWCKDYLVMTNAGPVKSVQDAYYDGSICKMCLRGAMHVACFMLHEETGSPLFFQRYVQFYRRPVDEALQDWVDLESTCAILTMEQFNDREETQLTDIHRVLDRAIEIATKEYNETYTSNESGHLRSSEAG
jgi:hypothetical protein